MRIKPQYLNTVVFLILQADKTEYRGAVKTGAYEKTVSLGDETVYRIIGK